MRSLVRYSLAVMAALMLGAVLSAPQSVFAQAPAPGPKVATGTSQLVFSEFRFSGPNGSADEYIEICNRATGSVTIQAVDNSVGWGVYAREEFGEITPVRVFFIPNGTTFLPGKCYLGANQAGFSLSGYLGNSRGAGPAAPDTEALVTGPAPGVPAGCADNSAQTSQDANLTPCGNAYTFDINNNAGLALFNSAAVVFVGAGFQSVQPGAGAGPVVLQDAVGFRLRVNVTSEPTNANIFRECGNPTRTGCGLTPILNETQTSPSQFAIVRKFDSATGRWQDTDENGNLRNQTDSPAALPGGAPADPATNLGDFFLVDTDASTFDSSIIAGEEAAVNAVLGSPGPQNYGSVGGVAGSPIVPGGITGGPLFSAGTGSPRLRSMTGVDSIQNQRFDPGTAGNQSPNIERTSLVTTPDLGTGVGVGSTGGCNYVGCRGTIHLRFSYRNNTGADITDLRFRLMELAVPNRAATIAGAVRPVYRLLNSVARVVYVTSGVSGFTGGDGNKFVNGLTLENISPAPPDSGGQGFTDRNMKPFGGGINSSMVFSSTNPTQQSGTPFVSGDAGTTNSVSLIGGGVSPNPPAGPGVTTTAVSAGCYQNPAGGIVCGRTAIPNNATFSVEFVLGIDQAPAGARSRFLIVQEARGLAAGEVPGTVAPAP